MEIPPDIQKLMEPVARAWPMLAALAVLALLLLIVLYATSRRRRRRKLPEPPEELTIDVSSLPALRPPVGGPTLYFYHVPVRLAVVVLAPAGRAGELPSMEKLPQAIEALVPGLAQVLATHSPIIRFWPPQLSVRGFAHAFFTHVRLPGQAGRGTPWCGAAGAFKLEGQTVMAGLVMRAEAATNLGQIVVERETQWLDILRIKPWQP